MKTTQDALRAQFLGQSVLTHRPEIVEALRKAGYGDILFLGYRSKHPQNTTSCRAQVILKNDNITVKDIIFR